MAGESALLARSFDWREILRAALLLVPGLRLSTLCAILDPVRAWLWPARTAEA